MMETGSDHGMEFGNNMNVLIRNSLRFSYLTLICLLASCCSGSDVERKT